MTPETGELTTALDGHRALREPRDTLSVPAGVSHMALISLYLIVAFKGFSEAQVRLPIPGEVAEKGGYRPISRSLIPHLNKGHVCI